MFHKWLSLSSKRSSNNNNNNLLQRRERKLKMTMPTTRSSTGRLNTTIGRTLPWAAFVVAMVCFLQYVHVSDYLQIMTAAVVRSATSKRDLTLPEQSNNNSNDHHSLNMTVPTTVPKKEKRGYYYRPIAMNASAGDNDASSSSLSFGGVQARAFPHKGVPCFEPEPTWKAWATQKTPAGEGLLFLKTYKTGSSTASGIDLRISRNIAKRRQTGYEVCKTRYDHGWAAERFWNLNPERSFVWSIVRDPTSRTISQLFHFHVSREKKSSTDESLIGRIGHDSLMFQDYYMSSLSLTGFPNRNKRDPIQVANEIIQQYDFIAITERMEESAVALSMVMGIPLADVLFLKAKGHGGYDDAGGNGSCTFITPAFVSEGMEVYFRSDTFQDMVQWDHLLYQAANKSLDLTIESLGREKFEQKLALYHKAQALAVERCAPTTRFPCTSNGQKNNETDCLWNDSGCGYLCLDDVATELGLWN